MRDHLTIVVRSGSLMNTTNFTLGRLRLDRWVINHALDPVWYIYTYINLVKIQISC